LHDRGHSNCMGEGGGFWSDVSQVSHTQDLAIHYRSYAVGVAWWPSWRGVAMEKLYSKAV
jgi:hypothetical protein